MAVETAADRLSFFDTEEFGVDASYQVSGGESATLKGIFDSPHFSVRLEHADVSDDRPSFFSRASDLPVGASADGADEITIEGTTYKVATFEPDGQGMILMRLAK